MHILIVEDNPFNAFCLTRLLQSVYRQIQVSVVGNSVDALNFLQQNTLSLVILDGDLRANNESHCNGPTLADVIWSSGYTIPIIAWTDSEGMQQAFADVFEKHNKFFNENHCWTKIVSQKRMIQTLAYYIDHSTSASRLGLSERKWDMPYVNGSQLSYCSRQASKAIPFGDASTVFN